MFECFDYYLKRYPDKQNLNEEEFDDIFSPILNDCYTYFAELKVPLLVFNYWKVNEKVNIFEAFLPLCIFAKGEFDKKIHGIFKAFD